MSAIGDYVHYTAYGYNVYGINRIGQNYAGDKEQVFINAKNQASKKNILKLSQLDKEEIENTISSFMTTTHSDGEDKQFMEWLFQKIGIEFTDTMPYLITDTTGNIQTKIKTIKNNTKYTKKATIENRIREIGNAITDLQRQIDKGGAVGTGNLDRLKIIKDNLVIKIKLLFSKAKEVQDLAGYEEYKDFKNFKDFKEKVRTDIISLINEAHVITKGLSNMKKGTFFELEAIYALAKAQGYGLEQFLKAVNDKKLWTGQNTSPVKISLEALQLEDTKKEINRINQLIGGNYTYNVNEQIFKTIKPSPNKVDFQINWKGQDLKFSAKNINVFNTYDINLVDKAPIFALLQSMDRNFVNHYLNIISAHRSGPRADSKYQSLKDIDTLQNAARLAMKINLLLAAFEGHKLGTDRANVFIINNNRPRKAGKRVKVFTIQELMGEALKNIENSVIFSSNRGDLDSFTILNSFQGTKASKSQSIERLKSVQAALHGWIISIKFNKEIVQNFF